MRNRTTNAELAAVLARNRDLHLKRPQKALILPSAVLGAGSATVPRQAPVAPVEPQARAARRDYKAELRDQLEVSGVPAPVLEFRFHPVRKWRFDMAYPARKVAIEYQGGIYHQGKQGHQTTAGIERDCLKFSSAASMGWLLLPVNAGMVRDGTALDLIIKALDYRKHPNEDS